MREVLDFPQTYVDLWIASTEYLPASEDEHLQPMEIVFDESATNVWLHSHSLCSQTF